MRHRIPMPPEFGQIEQRVRELENKTKTFEEVRPLASRVESIESRLYATKEVLTTSEASAFLGMSESYLYKLTSSKRIPHYKPNGRLVYFNRSELQAWAQRNPSDTQNTTV